MKKEYLLRFLEPGYWSGMRQGAPFPAGPLPSM